jgi:hypothetical protein
MELLLNALDLIPRSFRLLLIQLRGSSARQTPLCTVHDRHHHFQIAQQFGARSGWSFLLRLSLRFEKQRGIVENALADCRRAFAPGAIQLPRLTGIAVMLGEDRRHPLAILQALARHRHQKLQRHLCQDLALAHLLLDRFRQNLHQCQPSRHPTHAAVEPARQLLQPVAEALLQFRQQPAHLQRAFVFAQSQRAVQQHGRGFTHWPHHRFHRVPAQLLQSHDPFIAINDHVAVCFAFGRHHHDGRLLAHFRQRCQKPPLPCRMAHSQVLPAPLELVKLQLHRLAECKPRTTGGSISPD